MTDGDWVPFGVDEAEYRVLVDGVPSWLRPSLTEWTVTQTGNHAGSGIPNIVLETMSRTLRVNISVQNGSSSTPSYWFRNNLDAMPEATLLRVVDWVLAVLGGQTNGLTTILAQAGSKWTVGSRNGRPGLVAQVAEGVQDAAEAMIAQGGTAGKLLADAWQKVHRLDPDDSGAYADAVKAVEVASFEPLGIDNSKGGATLGQSIAKVRKDVTWRPPFEREHVHHPVNTTLVGMLRTLWVGHRDRHGKADFSNVTHQEAEAAVNLAVTLVGWFTSGAVQQRPEPEQFDG